MEKKICPLLLIAPTTKDSMCLQETCAWWIKRHEWNNNYPCQAHCGVLKDAFNFSGPDVKEKI